MSLLKGAASFVEFEMDKQPDVINIDNLRDRIRAAKFRDIEQSFDEYSIGWVAIDNMFNSDNFDPIIGDYVIMSLRIDERKVPTATLKKYVAMAELAYKQERQIPKISRTARVGIKERVRTELVRKAKPVSSVFDVVWALEKNTIMLFSTSRMAQALLADWFKETFGINIEPVTPDSLSIDGVGAIKELLTWLWYRSSTGKNIFKDGELIATCTGDKLLLESGAPGEKVACAYSQREAMEGLSNGKLVVQADVNLDLNGEAGVSLSFSQGNFYYKGVKLPRVKQDELDGGMVLERVYLFMATLNAMRDLINEFVACKNSDGWVSVIDGEWTKIQTWCTCE